MPDEVAIHMSASGGTSTRREIDNVRQGVQTLSRDAEASAVRAEAGMARASHGIAGIARSLTSLGQVNPALGSVTTGLTSLSTHLDEIGSKSAAAGGSLGARLAAGSNVATAALLAFAAVGVHTFTATTAQVLQFQRVSGATAQDASKLTFATHELGINADTAARAMFFLGRNVATGKAALVEYHVQIAHNRDNSVNLAQTLLNVSDAYNNLASQTDRNNLVQAAFGRGGLQLIPLLQQGRKGLQEFFDEAKKSGLVFDQKQLEQGRQFSIIMRGIESAGKGVAVGLGQAALPAVKAFGDVLTPMLQLLTKTGILPAVLGGLIVGQLLPALVAGSRAAWGMAASLVQINVAGLGAEAGLLAEASGATAAAAATSLFDVAMGGLPLLIGAVIGGMAVFSGHSHAAAKDATDWAKAINDDSRALGVNTAALGANEKAIVQKRFQDKNQIDDLARMHVTLDQVQASTQGTDKQFLDFLNTIARTGEFGDKYVKGFHDIGQAKMAAASTDPMFMASNRGLLKSFIDLHSGYQGGVADLKQLSAVGGDVTDTFNTEATATDKAAASTRTLAQAAQEAGTQLDTMMAVGAAVRNLAQEEDKYGELLKNDGTVEHAKRVEDLARATVASERATRSRIDAEQKLADINKRSLADETARAAVERDRAAFNVQTARDEVAAAEHHLELVIAAGQSPKTRHDAEQKLADARLKLRENTNAATDAEAKYKDVASGAQLEHDRADAILAVKDARLAEHDAQVKATNAYRDAQVPVQNLATSARDLADQLDRVTKAAEQDIGAQIAAGLLPADQAAQALFNILGQIATQYPQVGAILYGQFYGAIAPGFIPPSTLPAHAAGGYASGAFIVGERGPEVLALDRGASGWVYANHDPVTRAVLQHRASGGPVGYDSYEHMPTLYPSGGPMINDHSVRHETQENWNGPIIATGLTLEEVRREARRTSRRTSASKASRGR